jgi:hypothetical protein
MYVPFSPTEQLRDLTGAKLSYPGEPFTVTLRGYGGGRVDLPASVLMAAASALSRELVNREQARDGAATLYAAA